MDADLFLMSGRGGLTDQFEDEGHATLEQIRVASELGASTALLGQGIGPMTVDRLRNRAAEVLPRVDLIALREERTGPGLLRELGVASVRVRITGDDAIATALRHPASSDARSIGVSVRVAEYARMSPASAEEVLSPLMALGERLGAPLVPVPLSVHPHEGDVETLSAVLGVRCDAPTSPATALEMIGRCRVIATGTYHAALFALAQGVPAVCFSRSPYYDDKFLGLREMFGPWCEVIAAAEPDPAARVSELVERAYGAWPEPSAGLRAAARRQEEASRAAYKRLPALLAS
jgi:colanic acid/amylovoran biosynthesis protein